ncbi:DUF1254 domain-containing protein [Mycobacteroides abscessus]|nr:DUF1254 domain-containing protein [Mycobacteroides abscessus]MDM1889139.1 DUF1254 domain-containing protein [Mycobacteroides abscessus]
MLVARCGSLQRWAAAVVAIVGVVASACTAPPVSTPSAALDMDARVAAYVYTYPLVSVEVSRRQSTNYPAPDPSIGAAPMNQLAPLKFLPDAKFTGVVRPNVDTLYVSMFFDVAKEPLLVSVPDMGGRYHLFPILDMWTNVSASAGPRTVQDQHGYRFAIVGPNWRGSLPKGVREYRLPTDAGWMIGRIQVNGPDDVQNVIAIQDKLTAAPLSAADKPYIAAPNTELRTDWPKDQKVAAYIHNLSAQEYWDLYYSSLSHAQTRPSDQAVLQQLAAAGWSPDKKLDLAGMTQPDRASWEKAWPQSLSQIEIDLGNKEVDGWKISRNDIGDYGTNYAARAVVAYGGLGANLPQDTIYPATRVDADGNPLRAEHAYVLHFPADQIPPVRGFWSLTMYNEEGFFVDNPINRYAVRGERLAKNPDGSVDIYIQRENPGAAKESNWLPTPAAGNFNLLLRTYWPDQKIIDGTWNPPAVTLSH